MGNIFLNLILDCDRSCKGCTGDGPDMCKRCAKGYTLVNNMCVGKNFFKILFIFMKF